MKKVYIRSTALVGTVLVALLLSSCGYQGGYRYKCQDPVNWGKKECVPPECHALGLCTTDTLGFDPLAPEGATDGSTSTTGGTNG